MRMTLYFLLSLFLLPLDSAATEEPDTPTAVVEAATRGVITELNKMKVEERTEEQVRRLVMTYIVPAIDQTKIAMGALGKHWRRTNPEQRQQFIERFRALQIRTYTGAFRAFNGQEFSFDAARFNERGDRALVKGKLIQNATNHIPIDFRLYYNKKEKHWYIYDAVVAGLGMVKTYRQQLSERLNSISISQLLAELNASEENKNSEEKETEK